MKTATSVKAQIKYRANKDGRDVQDMFILYVLERVLYRLSVSQYKDNFVLKGGCLFFWTDPNYLDKLSSKNSLRLDSYIQ